MRAKYPDCVRVDRNCSLCSLVNYGRDCRNNPISPLEWARYQAGMTQPQLAEAAGIDVRRIQRLEAGTIDIANISARNLLALAEALDVEPRDLVPRS